MTSLSPTQIRLAEYMENLVVTTAGHLPSLVIHGPRGVGKRTVAAEVARRLGLRFVEVNVSDGPNYVKDRVFGTETEAVRASGLDASRRDLEASGKQTAELHDIVAPGELGGDEEKMVYLVDFDRVDVTLFQCFQQLVNGRTYTDARGNRWEVGDYTWIVAGLNYSDDGSHPGVVGLDHWICTCFEQRVPLSPPHDELDFAAICEAILGEYACSPEPDIYDGLMDATEGTSDGLHALRRWLVDAVVRSGKGASIRKAVVDRAIMNDLQSVFPRLRYRGSPLDMATFERWADQFDAQRSVAVHIIRKIAHRYYINERQYFVALQNLVSRSGIPPRGRVVFVKWQGLGQSAARVAHQIKNIAHWRVIQGEEINFNKTESDWPVLNPAEEHRVVLVDDFVGSGRTITPLFVGEQAPVRCLLSKLPKARLFVGIIAGFESGLREVSASLRQYGDRVMFVPDRLFQESDRCFHETSRVFPQETRREQFNRLSEDLPRDFRDILFRPARRRAVAGGLSAGR